MWGRVLAFEWWLMGFVLMASWQMVVKKLWSLGGEWESSWYKHPRKLHAFIFFMSTHGSRRKRAMECECALRYMIQKRKDYIFIWLKSDTQENHPTTAIFHNSTARHPPQKSAMAVRPPTTPTAGWSLPGEKLEHHLSKPTSLANTKVQEQTELLSYVQGVELCRFGALGPFSICS